MKNKIKGKIDRHYDIWVNGKKCKILSYKIKDSELTIITKLKNPNLWISGDNKGEICIEDENTRHYYSVEGRYAFGTTAVFEYSYSIIQEHIEDNSAEKTQ